jgi:hypothetical protein
MARHVEPTTIVRLDLFPATVQDWTTGVEAHDVVRLVVTEDEVKIFSEDSGGPYEAASYRLYDFSGKNTTGWKIDLDDGSALFVKRSARCGCGSRLRSFRPIPGSSIYPAQHVALTERPPFMM